MPTTSRSFIFLFLLLLMVSGVALAQSPASFTGTVVDAKTQAIPYANAVLVQAADSALFVGGVAGDDGRFTLPAPGPGRYRLRILALGYRRWQSPVLDVVTAAPRDFGTIQLQAEGQQLQEVVVQGMRPTVVQLADRLVVNVDGTALAAGNTAYDVLARAPGVFIDPNGAIQLNGKAGVQVMLDGKLTYLSAKELQTLLQSMSADNIKDLELIANPSAKYDAAGTAGLININLKKNQLGGLNGSVNAGTQYNGLVGVSAGGTLNYKRGAWNSFATLDLARRPSLQTRSLTRVFADGNQGLRFEQNGTERGFRTAPALRAGTDWAFRPGHTLGAMVNVLAANQDNAIRTNTSLRSDVAATNQAIRADNRTDSRLRSGTVNVHYQGQLDTAGTTLAADLDYVTLGKEAASSFANRTTFSSSQPERFELLTSDNPVRYDIYSAKLDVVRLLTKQTKLEAGAKVSQVTSDNDLLFYQVRADRPQLDPTRTNRFVYREHIYAAYGNLATQLHKNWSLQAGLRAEQTRSRGTSRTLSQTTERRFLDFFPSVFLQQTVSPTYQISYQYSRRINRPRYEDLNPFEFFIDPYTVARGNPALRPQYTNSFQLNQSWKSLYNLTLAYATTRDYQAELPLQNAQDTLTVFQQQNLNRFEEVNGILSVPVQFSAKWQASNVFTAGYQRVLAELGGEAVRNGRFNYFAQTNHTVQLPAKLRLELNGTYVGSSIYGAYRVQGFGWVDAGLKRAFVKEQLEVNLGVTDILRSRQLAGAFDLAGNSNAFRIYRHDQAVRLTLRYKFAKGEAFKSNGPGKTLEEVNRTDK